MPFIFLVIIGWLYVAVMMAVAEATNTNGTVLGGIFTFLLYGAAPVALVAYILSTPMRKRAIRAREKAEQEEAARAQSPGATAPQPGSAAPDGPGEAPAGAFP